jgi:xanthine dehydrogenase accessory factor
MLDTLPLLQTAQSWLNQGERLWLIHVARTWGSSPRPAGSLMLLGQSGRHAGSVSGGCVEGDLFQRLQQGQLDHDRPAVIEYGGDSNRHIRLPCRTTLQLVLEPLRDTQALQSAIDAIAQRRPLQRRLDIHSGGIDYREPAGEAAISFDGRTLIEWYGPRWRALLIGANDLGRHVARQCLALGYEVHVCDPREEYRQQWDEAETIWIDGMPDEAVDKLLVDDRAALLALTHDPRLDDMALMQALQGPAFYIGALGSKRGAERRKQTLAQMGLSAAQIERLDAPIGLNIGSRTPAEIAVAIAARLIQVRNTLQQQQPTLQALQTK